MFQIGDRRLLIAYLGKGCVKYVDALTKEGESAPKALTA
jgi:hypothetical protein